MGQYLIRSRCMVRRRALDFSRQGGITLLIALIALVAMTMAAIAMARSVDIAGLSAGNIAVRETATQASDVGVELALAKLGTLPLEVNAPWVYYGTALQTDSATNLPIPLDASNNATPFPGAWSHVPCYTASGASATCANDGNYYVQYVIDRQCTGTLPIPDVTTACISDAPKTDGSYKANEYRFSTVGKVYFRITVRITGPRNTNSIVQTVAAYG